MTISRAQMYRQLYQLGGGITQLETGQEEPIFPRLETLSQNLGQAEQTLGQPSNQFNASSITTAITGRPTMNMGGVANLVEREKYGIGSKLKKFVRNIIPNEIAEVAVKAAPFVAPFNPLLAGAMAGIGGFDQTGRIGSSLKSAALTYGAGQLGRYIGGAGFQEGFNPFAGYNPAGSFGGIGSLFTSPIGTQTGLQLGQYDFFKPYSNTPTQELIKGQTQVNLTGIDDLGQLGYAPGTTIPQVGPDALTFDPTTGKQLGRTAQELQSSLVSGGGLSPGETGRSASELLKTYGTQPGTEPGYIDLIKKAGTFENVPLSERFDAVKDLSAKALKDIYTTPITDKDGKVVGSKLDKNSLYATFAGASSYIEARKLADKAGIPESEFSEADYQRLKVQPEKERFTNVLKPGAFGIREAAAAEGGRIGYGIGDLVRGSGVATAIPGGSVSESRGLGGMIQRLIQQNPQMFRTQMSASRRDFIDNDGNGIDDREEAANGGLMDGVLSIKLTPAQAMAMGGRIGYQEGGFTDYLSNPIYQNFLNSPFNERAMGAQVITPVTLPTGEILNLPNAATAEQFRQYLSSTPAGGAPVTIPTPVTEPFTPATGLPVGTPTPVIQNKEETLEEAMARGIIFYDPITGKQINREGTREVGFDTNFITQRAMQAQQDAAARVSPTNVFSRGVSSNFLSPNQSMQQELLMRSQAIPTGGTTGSISERSSGISPLFRINRLLQAERDAASRVTPKKTIFENFSLPNVYETGGRVNYFMGSEIPVRQNQGGVTELDLRAKGGYIPVGIKEKADDVPAMLSKNEFVFTADAVRGAGNGNINKGAQKMYKLMKSLEKKVKKMKKVA